MQGRIEIVRYAQNAGQRAEHNARLLGEGNELRNRFTGASNDDFLAGRCSIDESRQVGLCFMDIDRCHELSLVQSTLGVKDFERRLRGLRGGCGCTPARPAATFAVRDIDAARRR